MARYILVDSLSRVISKSPNKNRSKRHASQPTVHKCTHNKHLFPLNMQKASDKNGYIVYQCSDPSHDFIKVFVRDFGGGFKLIYQGRRSGFRF